MTESQFLKRHGQQFRELRQSSLWSDLIQTIRTKDPARFMPAVDAESSTNHASNLLGRIAGFNLAVNTLTDGYEEIEEATQLEATYEDELQDQETKL